MYLKKHKFYESGKTKYSKATVAFFFLLRSPYLM